MSVTAKPISSSLQSQIDQMRRYYNYTLTLDLTNHVTIINDDEAIELSETLMLYCQEGLWREEAIALNKLLGKLPVVEQHQIFENMLHAKDDITSHWTIDTNGARLIPSEFFPDPDC